jgi:hypothetical protein
MGEKGILLGLIKAVNLIDKKDGRLLIVPMAESITSRNSLTPERTAENDSKLHLLYCAINLAMVVFPEPGGPQNITENSLPVSSDLLNALEGPRI